jgi:uncharacterized membrane protein YkvI
MTGRLLLVLVGAAVVGVAGGYLVTEDWVPWPVPVAAVLVATAIGVFTIRQRVTDAISAARAKTRP